MCFRKHARTEAFLCLKYVTFFNALSKTLLSSLVELKPFECFIWTYLTKLEILLLCVRSGWNRILIALVHLRKWKVKWIFHIWDSRSSIVDFGTLHEWSRFFSKTKSCVFFFVSQVRQTQLHLYLTDYLNKQKSMVTLTFLF